MYIPTVTGANRQEVALRRLPIAGDTMKMSLPLYDALTSISVSGDKATAVVNAWETDVENLASKSDLLQTEKHLKASISELGLGVVNEYFVLAVGVL